MRILYQPLASFEANVPQHFLVVGVGHFPDFLCNYFGKAKVIQLILFKLYVVPEVMQEWLWRKQITAQVAKLRVDGLGSWRF